MSWTRTSSGQKFKSRSSCIKDWVWLWEFAKGCDDGQAPKKDEIDAEINSLKITTRIRTYVLTYRMIICELNIINLQ